MFPGYGYMDSYPKPHFYQNSHIPYHHPSWEAKSEQAPTTYGPWSCSGSFGYPSPMQCHGCCSQMYHPGYYTVRPPHSHRPPPSSLYHHGMYSPCEAYPPYPYPHHYQVPPYHFMEQPRYGYDKDVNGRHCCGCQNHVCEQKEDKGVKIDEREPEFKKESGSLAPVKLDDNHPYPFVWIPPEYLKNKSENQAGEEKENERQKDEDERSQFPIPIYWLPAHDKSEDSGNKDHKDSYTSEQPVKLKIIPVNFSGKDGHRGKPDAMEDANGDRVLAKKAGKDVETEAIPMKLLGENGRSKEENEKKSPDDNLKNQTSSPKKGSKLPPVCLRVDPLPRRRSGNGTSRSPSPPGVKLNTNKSSDGTKSTYKPLKESSSPAEQVLQNKVKETQPKKDIEVVDRKQNVDEEEVPLNPDLSQGVMEQGREKNELSMADAAVLIQSFYRGFEVRKWEPLKKLKQIAKVREQASQVRKRIETLKPSTELQKVEKEKVLIGETIMSLLLQLDTIQGLHPTVRDIRKSVARELVRLQEGLDSLVCQTASEEENPEVTISTESVLQETEKVSIEEVKQPSELHAEMNSIDNSHPEAMESTKEENFEALEAAKEVNETSEIGSLVSAECLPVATNKVESEMENCTDRVGEVTCSDSQGKQETTAVEDMESSEIDSTEELPQEMQYEMSPTTDCKQVLLPGKDDSLVETVANEETPDSENAEHAPREDDSALQDKGSHHLSDDVLAFQVEVEKHGDAEYMTKMVSEELSLDSNAETAFANEDLQDKAATYMEEDDLGPEMVEGKLDDADHNTESMNEKPPFEKLDNMVDMENEKAGHVLSSEDLPASSMEMIDGKHIEDAVEAPQAEQPSTEEAASEATEILDNEPTAATPESQVHFHDKDVISESASLTKEPKAPSVTAETHDAEQEVPVKGEINFNNKEKEEAYDKGLMEENEKLRVLLRKLLQEGKQQLNVISNLNGRVKDLERKLTKKKKLRMRRQRAPKLDKCAV